MARSRAINRVRRRVCYIRMGEKLVEHNSRVGEDSHRYVEEEAHHSDCSHALKAAMAQLLEPQRQALQMTFYQGLSQREIAARTRTPLGTIKTRLELALKKVKAALLAVGVGRRMVPSYFLKPSPKPNLSFYDCSDRTPIARRRRPFTYLSSLWGRHWWRVLTFIVAKMLGK